MFHDLRRHHVRRPLLRAELPCEDQVIAGINSSLWFVRRAPNLSISIHREHGQPKQRNALNATVAQTYRRYSVPSHRACLGTSSLL